MSAFKLKETFSSSFSGDRMSSRFKELVQYGAEHPLRLFAGGSFLCFAVFPILAFISFALGTLLFTMIAAIVWQGFLVLCGVIGLAVALAAALTMAGCCTGAATLVYFAFVSLQSSVHLVKGAKTRLTRETEITGTHDSFTNSDDKED